MRNFDGANWRIRIRPTDGLKTLRAARNCLVLRRKIRIFKTLEQLKA